MPSRSLLILALAQLAAFAGDDRTTSKLTPDKAEFMLDEPMRLTMAVTNTSSGPIAFQPVKDENVCFNVKDEQGKTIGRRHGGMAACCFIFDGKAPSVVTIGTGRTFKIPILFSRFHAFAAPDKYQVEIEISGLLDGNGRELLDHYTAACALTVLPNDEKKLCSLIDSIGGATLKTFSKSSPDAEALAVLRHERAVPWLVKLLQTREYWKRDMALMALRKFKTDEAFDALKRALETRAGDIDKHPTITDEGAAIELRKSAAYALVECPYPNARSFILSQNKNPHYEIRLAALRAAFLTRDESSLAILNAASKDENENVRNAARNHLEEMAREKK